ncbi:bifunctional D-glycero-beta-D-manno-heptose-7-phosphate kinase/D-glycero-beta-D-manno-heptose 1-phosphate adenylyltransferase HldE [Thiomicrospira sp. WB1]|uniref:bifunctional D-glycero-beta-D-manno-heptose-7-phosphate kinase/D-glycero-beta-D-manno-heptose 1-phosphate adenylyltransferase HldE n=1 Tax=Thiomicrospira sp. WB1 TaxID=1685380 RepID=UPI00074ADCDD|nr:bifunctional D-glycero-beta-D-manno-heptose-7-phosphate kinase/D-glycero-beta-D-manno-heptose 1-phosphate adenylyltransferase HldE [Thiomicrospira sp. WB1]KUJ71350.1 bifunctional heptose 7-phosphate kinase/heptose 1-phosphate adenyltransferase [Thiomicrospira sp. WB1]
MIMDEFSRTRILVVGDVMLDQYWAGSAKRISPEAPVPVVKVGEQTVRAGGAANVALNVAALGAQATLMGVVGQDDHGQQLEQVVSAAGVTPDWVYSEVGTICKLRVLSHHQQLIRMDFEEPVPPQAASELAAKVGRAVAGYDALVISDYAKGSLTDVAVMIEAANQAGVPVLIDPKGDDFSRYRSATLIKPNQSEFEHIVGPCPDTATLLQKAESLRESLGTQALLITRSEHGMALVEAEHAATTLQSKAQEVFDVTGAGDTVMAALATAYASGMTLPQSVRLANEAAGLVVKKVGTSTVTRAELEAQWRQAHSHQGYASMSETEVAELVQLAQSKGEKVVFTNGCFDLLHSGHVRYLSEAARLGDRLVIGVNADASVSRLKGPSRPIVDLVGRMEVLSALSCVDWVVPFEEDTPQRLICRLQPDILVKGGDYQPDQIAGADCVLASGGQVEVLSFWQGHSTTELVKKAQAEEQKDGTD